MMNLGLHILKNPRGSYGFVGDMPTELGETVPANNSDVMGGRACRDESGEVVTMRFPVFDSWEEAKQHAEDHGHVLTCTCCRGA